MELKNVSQDEVLIDSFAYGIFYDDGIPQGPGGGSWVEGELEPAFGVDSENNATDFVVTQATPTCVDVLPRRTGAICNVGAVRGAGEGLEYDRMVVAGLTDDSMLLKVRVSLPRIRRSDSRLSSWKGHCSICH